MESLSGASRRRFPGDANPAPTDGKLFAAIAAGGVGGADIIITTETGLPLRSTRCSSRENTSSR